MSKTLQHQYSRQDLEQSILMIAQSLRTPEKWAQVIATSTADAVDDWIGDRGIITEADIQRVAGLKLQELSPDIAFVYQNYDNII